jgi:sugar O-acyltransferase (sialic acid O-acetyltransferase NeuD family)
MNTVDDTPREVIIVGAGGHGTELHAYLEALAALGKPVRLVGFVDDARGVGPWGTTRVLGGLLDLAAYVSSRPATLFDYITAVGDNGARRRLVERIDHLAAFNLQSWSLVHPRAIVGMEVSLGEGTCLAPGSIITTRVRIGRHCIVNVNASISHDCVIGDFTNINPGAVICGNVRLGESCYIGAGATIINNVRVGAGTIVGAGAVVTRDLPDGVTAVGVPARALVESASRRAV